MAMELYILTPNFVRDIVIEEFESCIWTERYTKSGDVILVLPATHDLVKQLALGKFLSLKGSKEVMIIDTQAIEDNMLTVTGNTLEQFMDERVFWSQEIVYNTPTGKNSDTWIYHDTPGQIIGQLFNWVMLSDGYSNHFPPFLGATYEALYSAGVISNLVMGPIADGNNGVVIRESVPEHTPAYSQMLSIAEAHKLGLSLYLVYAEQGAYQIKFTVFEGIDRTSGQSINQLLRFSPELDSLTNVKELRSDTKHKNAVRVFPISELIKDGTAKPIIVLAPGVSSTISGWNMRVADLVLTELTRTTIDNIYRVNGPTKQQIAEDFQKQKGLEFLAKNKRTRVIDGETVPQINYMFKTDYNLGDIVEVEGYTGKIEKVRITEYIRSQDQTGQREYPTLSHLEDQA